MEMAKSSQQKRFASIKRATSLAVSGSFFLAVLFLLADQWRTSRAASSSSPDGRISLLFRGDRPEPPATRMNALPLVTGEAEEAEASSPELIEELNTWTPTGWKYYAGPPSPPTGWKDNDGPWSPPPSCQSRYH